MLKRAVPIELAPLDAAAFREEACVLAIIVGVEGPSYRPIGAMMAIFKSAASVGSLSSGCVEADIKLHALDCLSAGVTGIVRYGRGSPYLDIVLPCGGGLKILLVPNPCRDTIRQILDRSISKRSTCSFEIQTDTGQMRLSSHDQNGLFGSTFRTRIVPDLRFLVFGKGPEAVAFTALSQSAGYETTLLSPDPSTLETAQEFLSNTFELTKASVPSSVSVDARTALILFFHDHDWEPPILQDALATRAFYIGAQGSQRARDNRFVVLQEMGINPTDLERIHGPIGLINSARDARTLAISVLAEVVAKGNLITS